MFSNAKLLNAFKLSSKVTVYVPATMHDEEIDNSKQVDEALTLLSGCFGGATKTDALGAWLSPAVGLIKEKTTIVFAYCSEADLKNSADKVVDFCEKLKSEMQQEAIALEINGEMYFV